MSNAYFFTETFLQICFIVFEVKNCASLFKKFLSGFGDMFMDTKMMFSDLVFNHVKKVNISRIKNHFGKLQYYFVA